MTKILSYCVKGLCRLVRDNRGSMVVETAIVAPVLVLMSIGGFDVSQMVARQHELQSGAAEAEAVALAANMGAETDTIELREQLEKSLGLSDGEITVTKVFRCDAMSTLVDSVDACAEQNYWNEGGGNDVDVSSYVKLVISDTYTPIWCHIGVGGKLTYKVERMIQLS